MEEFNKELNKVLSNWQLPNGRSKIDAWSIIAGTIRANQKRIASIKKWYWVAAACITFILLSYSSFYISDVNIETHNKEQLLVNLPDGSSVHLNSASTLSYNKLLWLFNRNVSLNGEAYFKVIKGSKFNVVTQQGTVSVLGTQFNIFARNTFNVACYKGSVKIKNNVNSVTILKGEKTIILQEKQLAKTLLTTSSLEPLWLSGEFEYIAASLKNVLKEISRQYDVTLTSSDTIEKNKFTGKWNNEMPLEDVLQIALSPFGLEAKMNPNDKIEVITSSK